MTCPICHGSGVQRRVVYEPTGGKTADGKVERKRREDEAPCAYCKREEFEKWAKK